VYKLQIWQLLIYWLLSVGLMVIAGLLFFAVCILPLFLLLTSRRAPKWEPLSYALAASSLLLGLAFIYFSIQNVRLQIAFHHGIEGLAWLALGLDLIFLLTTARKKSK
jgi:hypothetical protein